MAQLNATAQNDEESSSTSSFAMADVVNAICGIITQEQTQIFHKAAAKKAARTGIICKAIDLQYVPCSACGGCGVIPAPADAGGDLISANPAAEEDDTDPSDQASSPNVVDVEDSEVAAPPPSPVNVPPPVDVNSPVGAITIGRPPQVVIPAPGKWYAVIHGRRTGLFRTSGQASSHVLGVSGGLYSKYPSFEVALEAYLNAERDSAVTVLV